MNKGELVQSLATRTNVSRDEAERYLQAVLDTISGELKSGEEVRITGFGKFYVREQAAREGRNPRTGEKMKIAASRTPAFTAGRILKDSV